MDESVIDDREENIDFYHYNNRNTNNSGSSHVNRRNNNIISNRSSNSSSSSNGGNGNGGNGNGGGSGNGSSSSENNNDNELSGRRKRRSNTTNEIPDERRELNNFEMDEDTQMGIVIDENNDEDLMQENDNQVLLNNEDRNTSSENDDNDGDFESNNRGGRRGNNRGSRAIISNDNFLSFPVPNDNNFSAVNNENRSSDRQYEIQSKNKLVRILTHVIIIEILYGFYLDLSLLILAVRSFQLIGFARGSISEYKKHIALFVIVLSVPIVIIHLFFLSSGSFLLNFYLSNEEEQHAHIVLLLVVDFIIFFFQLLLLNTKFELSQLRNGDRNNHTRNAEERQDIEMNDNNNIV